MLRFNRVGTPAWWLNGKLLGAGTFGLLQIVALNVLTPIFRLVDGRCRSRRCRSSRCSSRRRRRRPAGVPRGGARAGAAVARGGMTGRSTAAR